RQSPKAWTRCAAAASGCCTTRSSSRGDRRSRGCSPPKVRSSACPTRRHCTTSEAGGDGSGTGGPIDAPRTDKHRGSSILGHHPVVVIPVVMCSSGGNEDVAQQQS